jgi:hypothetical protein
VSRLERKTVAEHKERKPGVRAIFINTLPKSGSVFITKALQEGLNRKQKPISSGYWMNDVIDEYQLYRASDKHWISQTHLPASSRNLSLYEQYTDRVVVHVRDPRQSTLSWCHHLNKSFTENKYLVVKADMGVRIPDWFFADGMYDYDTKTPHARQMDWLIEHNIRACVAWIRQWLDAHERERSRLRILFTTFEEFHRDDRAFFGKILSFMDIPEASFQSPAPPKEGHDHYRVGKVDEWRQVYTEQQQQQATALVPAELYERFGWQV